MLEGSLQRPHYDEAIPWCTHQQSAASVVASHQDDTGQGRVRGERLSKALSNISVEAGPLPPWGEHSEPQTTSRDLNSWTEQQRRELGSHTRALPCFQTVPPRSQVPRARVSARRGRRGQRGLRHRGVVPAWPRSWTKWAVAAGDLGSLASHCSSHQAAVWPHTNPMR